MNAAAVIHDGAHQAALGADQGVVQPGGNGDLRLLNVGLGKWGGQEDSLSREPSTRQVTSVLTSSLWIPRIRSRAASQLTFLPVMTIISELLFSVGRSILVLVSSRICRHQRPLNTASTLHTYEG